MSALPPHGSPSLARPLALSANSTAALLGLAAYATFSIHDLIVKHLGATYAPFQIVFFSALMGFPLITLVLIHDQKPGTLRPVHPWWITLRSICSATAVVCAFYAFGRLPLSQAYAIIFAAPLIITVLAVPMLGETVRLRRGIAVLVGLLGVLIVLRPGSSPLDTAHMAALMAAFAGALNAIVVRKIGNEERGVVMVLYPTMANLVLMAAILPFVYVEVPIADLGLFAVVAALVLLAMTFLVAAYARGDAIVVAPMQYSQIIWATVFGALLFEEYADWQTYAGTAVIVLSGIYILKREATGTASRNRPVLMTRTRLGHSTGLRVGAFLRRGRPKD